MSNESGRRYRHGYRLGCNHPVVAPRSFGAYFAKNRMLPTPPKVFGHAALVSSWGMLGNDSYGDCAIAGPYHAQMLWGAESGTAFHASTDTVLHTYATITGFDPQAGPPGDNPTDQGSDPSTVADYWQNTGIADDTGARHKIGAWVSLSPGNLTEMWTALYLFDGLGVCIDIPNQWMRAFDDHQPWDAIDDPDVEGGHYVLGTGRDDDGNLTVVTWGAAQPMTPAGYRQSNVATLAYLSTDKLHNGDDLNGFNLKALRADLAQLATDNDTTVH